MRVMRYAPATAILAAVAVSRWRVHHGASEMHTVCVPASLAERQNADLAQQYLACDARRAGASTSFAVACAGPVSRPILIMLAVVPESTDNRLQFLL